MDVAYRLYMHCIDDLYHIMYYAASYWGSSFHYKKIQGLNGTYLRLEICNYYSAACYFP